MLNRPKLIVFFTTVKLKIKMQLNLQI